MFPACSLTGHIILSSWPPERTSQADCTYTFQNQVECVAHPRQQLITAECVILYLLFTFLFFYIFHLGPSFAPLMISDLSLSRYKGASHHLRKEVKFLIDMQNNSIKLYTEICESFMMLKDAGLLRRASSPRQYSPIESSRSFTAARREAVHHFCRARQNTRSG